MKIQVQRILCPVDFSDSSDHAMRYASALAETFGAELTLLHVVAPIMTALPGETALPDTLQANIDELVDACRERLEQLVGKLAVSGLTVQHKVLNGVLLTTSLGAPCSSSKSWPLRDLSVRSDGVMLYLRIAFIQTGRNSANKSSSLSDR